MINLTLFKKFSDIKFIEKNDKKSKCRYTGQELQRNKPVWVLTRKKLDKRIIKQKISAEKFLSFTLTESPHCVYRILSFNKKESISSINSTLYSQLQKWFNRSIELVTLNDTDYLVKPLINKICGYTISYLRELLLQLKIDIETLTDMKNEKNLEFLKLNSILQNYSLNTKSPQYLFKNMTAKDFINKKTHFTNQKQKPLKYFDEISSKFQALKELLYILKAFSEKFNLEKYLTVDDQSYRNFVKIFIDIKNEDANEMCANYLKEVISSQYLFSELKQNWLFHKQYLEKKEDTSSLAF